MSDKAGIRFNNAVYAEITIDDGDISIITIDKDGNKTEYTATPKSTENTSAKKTASVKK